MASTIQFFQLTIISLSLTIGGCNKTTTENETTNLVKKNDSSNQNKKNSANSPFNIYNQEVYGTDDDGNKVEGQIILEGKTGIGRLINNKDQEIEVVLEIKNDKHLIGTDEEGFNYKLKID